VVGSRETWEQVLPGLLARHLCHLALSLPLGALGWLLQRAQVFVRWSWCRAQALRFGRAAVVLQTSVSQSVKREWQEPPASWDSIQDKMISKLMT
jgi:hypothetical protein